MLILLLISGVLWSFICSWLEQYSSYWWHLAIVLSYLAGFNDSYQKLNWRTYRAYLRWLANGMWLVLSANFSRHINLRKGVKYFILKRILRTLKKWNLTHATMKNNRLIDWIPLSKTFHGSKKSLPSKPQTSNIQPWKLELLSWLKYVFCENVLNVKLNRSC